LKETIGEDGGQGEASQKNNIFCEIPKGTEFLPQTQIS